MIMPAPPRGGDDARRFVSFIAHHQSLAMVEQPSSPTLTIRAPMLINADSKSFQAQSPDIPLKFFQRKIGTNDDGPGSCVGD
jgi:hypothetical protein